MRATGPRGAGITIKAINKSPILSRIKAAMAAVAAASGNASRRSLEPGRGGALIFAHACGIRGRMGGTGDLKARPLSVVFARGRGRDEAGDSRSLC